MDTRKIFSIRTKKEFEKEAIIIFRHQAKKNPVYKKYVEQLGVNPQNLKSVEQLPFLPIEFFKTQKVVTVGGQGSGVRIKKKISSLRTPHSALFLSSGTTGTERSRHYISDVKLYENSFRKCFELFYGDIKKYSILAFLPSYYENKRSSLLYMVNDLIKRSGKKESRFYKNSEPKILLKTLDKLLAKKKRVILFGVSFALLDLPPLPRSLSSREERNSLFVLETGGMKGRKEEITREELHKTLCTKFGATKIHSEYGMTELLSQAYSKGNGIFTSPPWMKVLIRDLNDPFSFLPSGRTGAINIIDLANSNSCAFIATQDVGRIHKNGSFEVLGRMDNSDLRGCNLLAG
ncbi:MAG: acyl transferase [Bacteroidetes bacterium]|nr:MAG: acyl transferase [Bacteroidota bacterium]